MVDIDAVEIELKKRRRYPYKWHYRQFDLWDRKTGFIYSTYKFDIIMEKINEFDSQEMKDYALVRWYNYWSAKAIEQMFGEHIGVEYKDNHSKKVDFTIDGIEFDHKTSVFPKRIDKDISFCLNNKEYLIRWLYEHQSNGSRKHFGNKIFLVLYRTDGKHWMLKAELKKIKNVIDSFFLNYNVNNFTKLKINNIEILSDVIWMVE